MTCVIPLCVTGVNGLPVTINARPSVHAIRSAAVASARDAGLESGKMMGRSVCRAMSRTIASVKAPGAPDAPISMVGRTRRITSAKAIPFAPSSCFQALDFRRLAGIGSLIIAQPVAEVVGEQSVDGPRTRTAWSHPRWTSPHRIMASRSWSAMPMPAMPAPKMTTRWLRSGVPQMRTAEMAPPA